MNIEPWQLVADLAAAGGEGFESVIEALSRTSDRTFGTGGLTDVLNRA